MSCMYVWLHTNTSSENQACSVLSSCPPYCCSQCALALPILLPSSRAPSLQTCETPKKQWVLLCLLRAVGLELVYVVHLCVAACFHVCVFTELEQGALGGVFCCSWGATVLSPNRSLVPAVVPGKGFWMRGSNFTHIHTHKYAHTSSILSSSSASPTTLSFPLGLAEKQRGSGAGVGWDVWGGALWPLSY